MRVLHKGPRIHLRISSATWRHITRISLLGLRALEIAIVVLFALSVAQKFQGTGPRDLISGGDAFTNQQGRIFWDHVRSCGQCAFWNGDIRGGAPAASDALTDTFYPTTMAAIYAFGTVQGSKVALAVAIVLAGIATWWLAAELGLSWGARVAAGCMGAAASHTAGKMEQGLLVVVTSIAAATLVLPAILRIYRVPTWRSAALLGLTLGLTALAGQGYLQMGLVMLLPLSLILFWRNPRPVRQLASRIAVAGIVALLIGMPFLLPFARVYGMFDKVYDLGFSNMQPARYLALNLVISDRDFLRDHSLGKIGFAGWYIDYIGWIPVGLAFFGCYLLWRRSPQTALFLGCFTFGAFLIGGGAPFKWLTWSHLPENIQGFAYSVRIPAFIASLAVPPLIGFAAVTIDHAFSWRPKTGGAVLRLGTHSIPGRLRGALPLLLWIVTTAVIIVALRDMRTVARSWISTETVTAETAAEFLQTLETDSLAWVSPMNNDGHLQLIGLIDGLKYSDTWRSWTLDQRPFPPAYLAVQLDPERPGMHRIGAWGDYIRFMSDEENQYATASSPGDCRASGEGGNIDVTCTLASPGRLTVQENQFGDWTATIDGVPTTVGNEGQWIAVDLPAGSSDVVFRYRPIDVWIGIALGATGYLLAVVLFLAPEDATGRLRRYAHRLTTSGSATRP